MKRISFSLGKLDVDLVNEWHSVFYPKHYNWVEFHPLMLRGEFEKLYGIAEIELYLFGFGVRFYWVWNKKMLDAKLKEYGMK
jgi:hypothetical protein